MLTPLSQIIIIIPTNGKPTIAGPWAPQEWELIHRTGGGAVGAELPPGATNANICALVRAFNSGHRRHCHPLTGVPCACVLDRAGR